MEASWGWCLVSHDAQPPSPVAAGKQQSLREPSGNFCSTITQSGSLRKQGSKTIYCSVNSWPCESVYLHGSTTSAPSKKGSQV